ncbi:MAG: acyl-CoA reductase [Saprospiraceae bacterium]|nr:acyl-CoA reductase [Saprospiraceae bacterium]
MLINEKMSLAERIDLLIRLGEYLQEDTEAYHAAVRLAGLHNGWFTKANVKKALSEIQTAFLEPSVLKTAPQHYPQLEAELVPKSIGLVLAGNIPAVGFHDILCVFLAGHKALIKPSSKDKYLIHFLLQSLYNFDERAKQYLEIVPVLKGMDAVIATGSNNSALYFEQYFSKYQHIIRKNRNAVAILDGTETDEELSRLGKDIFNYFGLGCRSVSKLYLPQGYDRNRLMKALDEFADVMEHNKYKNNYDYNRSIYLLNQVPHLTNDCMMLLENEQLVSRIATLHYEYYTDEETLKNKLLQQQEATQCISTKMNLPWIDTVDLGHTQSPSLWDYADNVDTLDFLLNLASKN